MLAFFNELSLPKFESSNSAKSFFSSIGEIYKSARSMGVRQVKIHSSFNNHEFAPGYSFNTWYTDRSTDSDLRQLLLDALTTTPYADDILTQYEQDNGKILEMKYEGIPCIGLGLASNLIYDTLAISYSGGHWNKDSYNVSISSIEESEDGSLSEAEISGTVRNIALSAHYDFHKDFLQTSLKHSIHSGVSLWERKSSLFPALQFCDIVKVQLAALNPSGPEFTQVLKRLFELEAFAEKWDGTAIKPADFSTKVSPESESRLTIFKNELTVICPDSTIRLFSWHARYTPGAGRIYFSPDNSSGRLIIGRIGLKLT